MWPGATTKPHPLLYTSGSQGETIGFAAKNQFGIALSGSLEYVKECVEHYRSQCQEAGWTPRSEHVLVRGVCSIGESDQQAEEIRERMLPDPEEAIMYAESVGTANPYDTHRQAPKQAAPPPFFPVLLNGSVSTVLEQAREFAKAGVGVMDLVPDFGGLSVEEILTIVHRLGNDVLPTLHTFSS